MTAGLRTLVTGASDIARSLGVSERVIGLTLVALGTSLPELAAAVVAARRRLADLVLDYWVTLGISVLALVALASRRRLQRFEGAVLLAIYCGYTAYLFWPR